MIENLPVQFEVVIASRWLNVANHVSHLVMNTTPSTGFSDPSKMNPIP